MFTLKKNTIHNSDRSLQLHFSGLQVPQARQSVLVAIVHQASNKVTDFKYFDLRLYLMHLKESLFIITGKLLWTDGNCYNYELQQLENCKNKLKLNETYVICDDEEKENDVQFDDYELFNTFENHHRQAQNAKAPPVKVDRETICKIFNFGKIC